MRSQHNNVPRFATMATATAVAVAFVFYFGVTSFAQSDQLIRGVVASAEDREPIPGANIHLKGVTSVGTFSDNRGEFTFPRQLRPGDVLVFSFLGLKTTEYVVPESTVERITILMPIDPIQMVEEVLVADGDQKPMRRLARHAAKRKVQD